MSKRPREGKPPSKQPNKEKRENKSLDQFLADIDARVLKRQSRNSIFQEEPESFLEADSVVSNSGAVNQVDELPDGSDSDYEDDEDSSSDNEEDEDEVENENVEKPTKVTKESERRSKANAIRFSKYLVRI